MLHLQLSSEICLMKNKFEIQRELRIPLSEHLTNIHELKNLIKKKSEFNFVLKKFESIKI